MYHAESDSIGLGWNPRLCIDLRCSQVMIKYTMDHVLNSKVLYLSSNNFFRETFSDSTSLTLLTQSNAQFLLLLYHVNFPWQLWLIIITYIHPPPPPPSIPSKFLACSFFEKWMNNVCWASPRLRLSHSLQDATHHKVHHSELSSYRNTAHVWLVACKIFYSCQDSLI